VSLYPLPGYEPDDDYDEGETGCAECEHFELGHYPGGCRICDDINASCPGYAEP
jgi:hypothetical protein